MLGGTVDVMSGPGAGTRSWFGCRTQAEKTKRVQPEAKLLCA
jgi:hypothetical protein